MTSGMTIEEMQERKRALGYSNQKLSELSDVPLGTVQKIFGGVTKAPRRETILALEKVLKSAEETEEGTNANQEQYDFGAEEKRGSRMEEVAFKYRAILPAGAPDTQAAAGRKYGQEKLQARMAIFRRNSPRNSGYAGTTP